MNNFGRVLRLALRYRLTLAGAIVSALAVALLWGGNITAIYPVVEVVFKGQSLPQWIEAEIEREETTSHELRQEIATLQQQLATAAPPAAAQIERDLTRAQLRLDAELEALQRHRLAQPYLHAYMPEGAFATLLLILAVLLVATIIKDVFLIASTILAERLAQLSTLELRRQFYRRALEMDVNHFSEQGRGDLLNRFTSDVQSVSGGVRVLMGRAIREPLKMIACLTGAAIVCGRLLVLSLVIVPIAAYLIDRLAKSLRRANRRAMEEMSLIYDTLNETFAGIKVVKAFTMEAYERRRLQQIAKAFFYKSMKIARYDSLVRPLTEIMGMTIVVLAILAGGYLSLAQETHLFGIRMSERPLSLGMLFLFYGLLAGVSDPARKLSDVFGSLQRAAAASDRIYQMLDRAPKVSDPARAEPLRRHMRELVFENVSFGYDPAQLVLEQIDLKIAFGETIALVGGNGCGKSTLASLIPRFFDPTSGRITLDGHDLRDVRLRSLRKQIGMVTQETLLFDETVLQNIRYGSPRATQEQIVEAAKRAHAHRFIENKLASGYDTKVGPGGQKLSGGQRQRIALARAILRDPALLILDEATSQIDVESEQLIHQVLTEFIRHRTTIIITHRVSTLALADRILVMDQGRILDIGTHDELTGRCDYYGRFFQLGFRETA
ncbi:MAG: ABC transporter ATP-binding protein [Pirellulales bacterium]